MPIFFGKSKTACTSIIILSLLMQDPFQGLSKHINVWSPEPIAIGYIPNNTLPLGKIALKCNSKRKVWWCFLMISCTFWKSKHICRKLSCGFYVLWFHIKNQKSRFISSLFDQTPNTCSCSSNSTYGKAINENPEIWQTLVSSCSPHTKVTREIKGHKRRA